MGVIESAEAVLRQWRLAHLSKIVQYKRGSTELSISATQADTDTSEVADEILSRGERVDWILERTALGALVLPAPGDQVTSNGLTYEVCDLGDQRCYRRHGRDGSSLRVHSKRVAT